MHQLPLNLSVKLLYAADNFYVHAGVRELLENITGRIANSFFSLSWIYGPPKTGKSHLAIRLMQDLSTAGFLPKIMTGTEFGELLPTLTIAKSYVFVVDDAHSYFLSATPGTSGPFVAFAEQCRRVGAHAVFFSREQLSALPCDDHIMSRLSPGAGFEIGSPAEEDLEDLLYEMARQRGLEMTEVKRQFLTKRLRREVAALDDFLARLYITGTMTGKALSFQTLSDSL